MTVQQQTAVEAVSVLAEAVQELQAETWGAPMLPLPEASTIPFRMRLPAVQQRLTELQEIRVGDVLDTGWVLDLDEARDQADQALEAMTVTLTALTGPDASDVHLAYRLPKRLGALKTTLARLLDVLARWPEPAGPAALEPEDL